ncbi:NADH-quinone oxidoreductase subunit L [bacterium]|nr:NADH-quinone oxidoreductase subunit L [bacterium]
MAVTFIIAAAVFLQVKNNAPHVGHGHEHAAGDAHHGGADSHGYHGTLLERWNAADIAGDASYKAAIKAEHHFVKASGQPWDTDFREGLGGYVPLWTWFEIPGALGDHDLKVEMAFHVDQLSSIFLLFISFVGTLVFVYANGYMKEHHDGHEVLDEGFARFFSYLALFAASMYTLILGANFAVMFIGWEGVGLCSYLLIGYYFDRRFSAKLMCADAGKKAFVANRVGDFGLMLGMFLLFWGLGTLDFQTIISILTSGEAPAAFGYSGAIITAATLLLFLGATGKSAQIPLFVWLPDAMAGPTPVSALIHAATMVTAGIYMLARLNVLYMLSPTTMLVVAIVGGLTALVAAFVGLTQRGIKKILAYSTVSQLGYMFLAMGVGAFAAGVFHVFTHAFFKACLFLAAGSIIHALHHEEDVFKMGGLKSKMPLTFAAYGLATLAIAGIFPFAGFWSKDEILYMTYLASTGGDKVYLVLYIMGVLTAAMTAFYMGRSLVLPFFGKTRMEHEAHGHDHHHHGHDDHGHGQDDHGHDDHGHHHGIPYEKVKESSPVMTSVLLTLAVASCLVGFLNVPKALNMGFLPDSVFHHFLAPVTDRGALYVASQQFGFAETTAPYGADVVGGNIVDGVVAEHSSSKEQLMAVFSVIVAALGLFLAWWLYSSGDLKKSENLARKPLLSSLWSVSWNAWWWDDIYDALFVRGGMRLYDAVLWFDKTIIDGFLVLGVGNLCRRIGVEFRRLQNGQVQVYGLVMVLGVCLFLLYFAIGLAQFLGDAKVTQKPQNSRRVGAVAAQVDVVNR